MRWWCIAHLQEGLLWMFSHIEILGLGRWSNQCLGWWSKYLALGIRHQLDKVNIFVPLPENLPSRLLYCNINIQQLELGIKGNPPYLNVCAPDHSMTTYFWLLIIAYVIVKALLAISFYSYFRFYMLLLYVEHSLHIDTYKDKLS